MPLRPSKGGRKTLAGQTTYVLKTELDTQSAPEASGQSLHTLPSAEQG